MSYETGTATSHTDLLDKLNTFLTSKGSAFGLSYTGTGDGAFEAYSGGSASVAETFTITATSSTSFSVVGSVSGSVGTATVGTPFATTKIAFTIQAGGAAFVAGDEFKINTAPKWTALRSVAGSEYIWSAPGNDGTRQIYVGGLVFSNVTGDYYNIRLGGFIGYDSGLAFAAQPGACARTILPLWASATKYWFVANGSSVRVVALVSTVYVSAYLGFIVPYGTPGEWNYPIMVGGSMAFKTEPAATSTSWRWSNTTEACHAFPISYRVGGSSGSDDDCQLRLRIPSGNWTGFGVRSTGTISDTIYPYHSAMLDWRPNLDGAYPLFPVLIVSRSPANTWGRLDGVFATTGHAILAESEITVGRDRYLVFPDVFRSGKNQFYALKLD